MVFLRKIDSLLRGTPFWVLRMILAGIVFVLYSNTLSSPFIYDDLGSILHNSSIQNLRESILPVFQGGEAITGRPVLHFTLALNYHFWGLNPWGYHLFNILIHSCLAVVLLDFGRRILGLASFDPKIQKNALWIATSVVLVWAFHPIQTQAVSYIAARSETMMSLFYLLTLYCLLRSYQSIYKNQWLGASVFFCYLGMGTKEVMVSAPLATYLFDRIFIEREASKLWKERRWYYWGLISSLILWSYLVVRAEGRGNVIGFFESVSPWENFQTQSWALCYYLKLVFWPKILVFDYGVFKISDPQQYISAMIAVMLMIMGTIILFYKRPSWGFFLLIPVFLLAPSSSFIHMQTQTMVEYRVYLALAFLLLFIVILLHRFLGKWVLFLSILLSIPLGYRTYVRNQDYQSAESIWRKTVSNVPSNPRAHHNYAVVLHKQNKWQEAEFHLHEAIERDPYFIKSYLLLGLILELQKRNDEAEMIYLRGLERNPKNFELAGKLESIQ